MRVVLSLQGKCSGSNDVINADNVISVLSETRHHAYMYVFRDHRKTREECQAYIIRK